MPNNYEPRFTSSFKFHPSKCYFQTSLIPKCYNSTRTFIRNISSSLFSGLLGEHFLLARKLLKYYESKSHQFCKQNQIFNSFTMFNCIGLRASSAILKWFASIKRVEHLNFSSHEVNTVMFTTNLNIRLLVAFRGSFPYNGTHIVVGILL